MTTTAIVRNAPTAQLYRQSQDSYPQIKPLPTWLLEAVGCGERNKWIGCEKPGGSQFDFTAEIAESRRETGYSPSHKCRLKIVDGKL